MNYGTEIVVFLIVFFIVVLLFCFYILIRKENPMVYNFSPFPSVSPEDLPNANVSQLKLCQQKVFPCQSDLDCSKNCGPDFSCTTVVDGENVHYNGMKVEPGQWCLPSGKDKLGCGTYTGRAVWSSGPDCGDANQCWQCVCLYPSLFGGDSCNLPIACVDTTTDISDPNQSDGNYLVNSKGQKWDPTNPDFLPPDGMTPYALQSDGKTPVFTCSCSHNSGQPGTIQYTPLPNDPYNCHTQPCEWTHEEKWWNPNTQECECPQGQTVKSPVDGICRAPSTCDTGGWNDDYNVCGCATVSKTCNSQVYPRPGEPDCPDKCNPVGSYCTDPCEEKPCIYGTCGYVPDASTASIYYCKCPDGSKPPVSQCSAPCKIEPVQGINTDYACFCGTDTAPTDTTKPFCQTTTGDGCKDNNSLYVYSGKNCEQKCVPSGNIGTGSEGMPGSGCDWEYDSGYNRQSCCIPAYTSCSTCNSFSNGHIYCNMSDPGGSKCTV